MAISLRIKPDLRKAEIAAKLMAQQYRNTGAMCMARAISHGCISSWVSFKKSLKLLAKLVALGGGSLFTPSGTVKLI